MHKTQTTTSPGPSTLECCYYTQVKRVAYTIVDRGELDEVIFYRRSRTYLVVQTLNNSPDFPDRL